MEFERLELLIGKEKINRLKNKSVLILGVGGVGGYVVETLARSGIGNLILVDYDNVDVTNINRQIIATHDNVGKSKIECFKKRIATINPNCLVNLYNIFYNDETKDIIFNQKIDYIIDCCDSINSKILIIKEAKKRLIPIISCMGTGNKFYPEYLKFSKLKNTSYDPLAKKMRYLLKDDKACLNTMVVYSEELPIKNMDKIGSTAFVPSVAGIMLASYVVNKFIEGENNEIS